jgi:hypothetical protein
MMLRLIWPNLECLVKALQTEIQRGRLPALAMDTGVKYTTLQTSKEKSGRNDVLRRLPSEREHIQQTPTGAVEKRTREALLMLCSIYTGLSKAPQNVVALPVTEKATHKST